MPKRRKITNSFKGLNGGSSAALNNGEDNVSIQGKEPNVDSFSNTQSGNAIERQIVRKPNVEKDNVSIQGKEPNVDSFSNTQSGNAAERQTIRKPNVKKDQGKTTKPNVSKVAQSYSHNVSESSATPSHNVTTKKNIKRKTFASNVSSGNVKRKKSVPKSVNCSSSVSESSVAQSGTVGRSAAQSGTVGRSAARTNTMQTQSGIVGRSAAPTVNTTQTQSDTVGRSSAHTKQTRSGTAGRSFAHIVSSSSYTRSGNGTKRRSSIPKVKTTRADSAIEKQTIRRRTKHSWIVDIINGEGLISHNAEAKVSDMFNLKEGVRVIVEWDKVGFYICWGCLVWVPSIYNSPGMYLVNHSLSLYILLAGILCTYINYDCDRQRQQFCKTHGKCLIWGKAPSKIVASYTTGSGETKTSLLLTSGWWGLDRHFHYVREILAAFFWTVPALFNHFLPYFYVIFLTILLFDEPRETMIDVDPSKML
ncbi:hypothetical protein ACFE04_004792 [Oxalis oulophora]